MAITFPSNPTLNQTYTNRGVTWQFNGNSWAKVGTTLTSISSNVVPAHNEIYDLGHNTLRWRDLFLSGNTINLGGNKLKSNAGGIELRDTTNNIAPIIVSSIQIQTGANTVTLQAAESGVSTVSGGNIVPVGGATVTVANVVPTATTEGSLWLDSDTGDFYVRFGNAWATVSGGAGSVGATGATGASGSAGSNGATGATGPAGSAANIYGVSSNSVSYFSIPVGNTAQRPETAANGAMRINTTNNRMEVFYSTVWQTVAQLATGSITATGGTITTSGGYKIHTFTQTGSFNISAGTGAVEYLVLGGGGGSTGGRNNVNYGSGGAGGVVRTGSVFLGSGSYVITIGSGGTTGGGNGGTSSFDTLVTAQGGNGAGTLFAGANNLDYLGAANGGGGDEAGGGAGAGGNAVNNAGGPGYLSSISGTATYYGGGGGGANSGLGGLGGGGNAYNSAQANTGGGAGGASAVSPGMAGGSGLVILRYTL